MQLAQGCEDSHEVSDDVLMMPVTCDPGNCPASTALLGPGFTRPSVQALGEAAQGHRLLLNSHQACVNFD